MVKRCTCRNGQFEELDQTSESDGFYGILEGFLPCMVTAAKFDNDIINDVCDIVATWGNEANDDYSRLGEPLDCAWTDECDLILEHWIDYFYSDDISDWRHAISHLDFAMMYAGRALSCVECGVLSGIAKKIIKNGRETTCAQV